MQVFIACPSSSFTHKFSALGGVRVITHHLSAGRFTLSSQHSATLLDGFGSAPPTEDIDLTRGNAFTAKAPRKFRDADDDDDVMPVEIGEYVPPGQPIPAVWEKK